MERASADYVRDDLAIIMLENTSWHRKVRWGAERILEWIRYEKVFLVLLTEGRGKKIGPLRVKTNSSKMYFKKTNVKVILELLSGTSARAKVCCQQQVVGRRWLHFPAGPASHVAGTLSLPVSLFLSLIPLKQLCWVPAITFGRAAHRVWSRGKSRGNRTGPRTRKHSLEFGKAAVERWCSLVPVRPAGRLLHHLPSPSPLYILLKPSLAFTIISPCLQIGAAFSFSGQGRGGVRGKANNSMLSSSFYFPLPCSCKTSYTR